MILLDIQVNSLQGLHDAVRHMVAKHAGMDDDLDVILFVRPHHVVVRFLDSLKRENPKINTVYFLNGQSHGYFLYLCHKSAKLISKYLTHD